MNGFWEGEPVDFEYKYEMEVERPNIKDFEYSLPQINILFTPAVEIPGWFDKSIFMFRV
jgi:hypothetical protein